MKINQVGIERGRSTLPQLAAQANAGHASLLTKHGKPYAAIVAPGLLTRVPRSPSFLALRGSGKGLWGKTLADTVAELRGEWE